MARQKCISSEIIYDYALGALADADAGPAGQHIEECPSCQARLAEANRLVQALEADAQLEVPSRVRQRAVAFFQPWYETRRRDAHLKPQIGLKKYLAHLMADTRGQTGLSGPVVAGLRSTLFLNRNFQLLFSFDDGRVELDLKVSETTTEGHFNILGQVVGLEGKVCQVELVTPANKILPASLDETFTFEYQGLPAGNYSLNISCGHEIFEIIPLDL
jgi:hypothetical protein